MKENLFPESPILIADDEEAVLTSLAMTLRSNGMDNIVTCSDSRNVMGIVSERDIEAVLLDLSMPHIPGDRLLSEIHDGFPHIPVIIVTGTNEVKAAVECMKSGAFDYMVKAVEESRLVSGVLRAIEIRELKRECGQLSEKLLTSVLRYPDAFAPLLTRNKKMHALFLLAETVSRTSEPVLITGETGVGKRLLAQAIHAASGRTGAFVDINVAGLDDTMFADTLFGHKKGAFTGALEARAGMIQQGAAGTILLDEIGDLSTASQIKLLRLLDTLEYFPLGSDLPKRSNARIVAATNRDLPSLIAQEKYRRDLYYRFSTHELRIPPLRERKDDLPLLLDHFLQEASVKLTKKKPAVPPELIVLLETYHFPGNIRELRSLIFDAVSKLTGPILPLSSFREVLGRGAVSPSSRDSDTPMPFPDRLPSIKQVTDWLVEEALKRSSGNQSIAAGLLGITHQALSKRLQRKR
jgi:DNA-binding NtrC family response regulator